MPTLHPIDKVAQLFTDLENALDDAWAEAETLEQETFCLLMLSRVQALSGELAYELAEKEDDDSYRANKAGDVDDIPY